MPTNSKNRAQPKTRQKSEIFSMMHAVSHRIWIFVRTRKMSFKALVFTLHSEVDLIWTRAIRSVIVQSAQFSKIAKQLNVDLCQSFSHWKEALFLLKSWNKKWASPYSFCGRAAESAHQMHFLHFFREDWSDFQSGMYVEGGRKH